MFKNIGPGVLVAAAFIGPGTVTACSLAGIRFGYNLLWALLLSILATMVLQEMAARLGLITQKGLGGVINKNIPNKSLKVTITAVVLGAILIGNTAYEAGNIGGAVLGLEAIFGKAYLGSYPWIVGLLAFTLLWFGSYKVLERFFVGLISLMSLSFLITAILTKPKLLPLLEGLFLPKIEEAGFTTILALVGTTVVPYNLFLHANLVNKKWKSFKDLKTAQIDTVTSIAVGGLVSMAIVVCAASIPKSNLTTVMDLALGLQPLYGKAAVFFMGVGLFAAGLTSAITAPLAAAYVANSCFNWNVATIDWRFRMVWSSIIIIGVLSLSFHITPIQIIKFAQIANGVLLPIIAILLVWMVNNKKIMSHYSNTPLQNFIALLIIVFAIFLGLKSVLKVVGILE
ncbi:Nramp family divalent metal transporter [Croceivirga sp. JEA036]|uniref:Nramp family divalent metal transporter n=1 Tax=Croceivirga sp. JEA036 TaxID=2721162 RepID=UPI00143C7B03|nr:Nramp family divalent metal transporter [Croceivirga sp. JEA036]NJB35773.1 Nramp family divalent metal transporter [Croceivirga sp. JEA036]